MSHELTREQVAARFLMLKATTTHAVSLERHEAALRARIAELEQECARLSVFHADDEPSWRHRAEKVEQQLAAAITERDAARNSFRQIRDVLSWHADASSRLQAFCEKQAEVNGLEQQLPVRGARSRDEEA